MTKTIKVGYMALNDSAPIIVAKEMGFYAEQGLNVTLHRQNSWATLRDKLHYDQLDAAQMLAPMPLASNLGLGCNQEKIFTPLVLSLNGNAITLSSSLINQIKSVNNLDEITLPLNAEYLHPLIEMRKQNDLPSIKFAHVFPFSCHYYQLSDWLFKAGVSLDDVEVFVIPPKDMVSSLEDGSIDGFCVGGPYNAVAVRRKLGTTVATSCDLWGDAAEKVLAMKDAQYIANRDAYDRLVKATKAACLWLNELPNRFEAAVILSSKKYLDLPLEVIAPSLLGSCLTEYGKTPRTLENYNIFCGRHLDFNAPRVSDARTFAAYMLNAGLIDSLPSEALLSSIYRAEKDNA